RFRALEQLAGGPSVLRSTRPCELIRAALWSAGQRSRARLPFAVESRSLGRWGLPPLLRGSPELRQLSDHPPRRYGGVRDPPVQAYLRLREPVRGFRKDCSTLMFSRSGYLIRPVYLRA